MKKVLFATTALIATAGMAAADVKISGYGRFGLDYNDANDTTTNGVSETNITSRLRLQFDMSTEADSGVAFGARFRAQAENRDGAPGTAAFNGAQFHVKYGALRVNVGNIWGAVDNARGLYLPTRSVGTGVDGMGFNSLALGNSFNWDNYSSGGAGTNGIEALYSAGGFTGHISYSQRNGTVATAAVAAVTTPVVGGGGGTVVTTPAVAAVAATDGESRLGVMVSYDFGDYFVTAAHQSSSDGPVTTAGQDLNDVTFVAAGGDWGQFGAQLAYGTSEAASSWTLAGNVDLGAASNLVVWVNSTDSDRVMTAGTTTIVGRDGTSYGINYQYDLGGGATFVAGYVDNKTDTIGSDQKQFQAGVYFNF